MGRRIGLSIAAGLIAGGLLGAAPARADDDLGMVSLGLGTFDVLHDYKAAEGRFEYRMSQSLFHIKPLIGVLTTNRQTVYGYFGLRAEIPIFQHFLLIPIAAVGYYNKGNGKDIGSHAEFKTGGEIDYRFDGGLRVGIAFDHMSNAGITAKNPGVENLLMVFSVPLDSIVNMTR